jgi:hypothetical protein
MNIDQWYKGIVRPSTTKDLLAAYTQQPFARAHKALQVQNAANISLQSEG